MRILPLVALLGLAACNSSEAPPAAAEVTTEVWQAGERDRFCQKGDRAGFIIYGEGRGNCSARGKLEWDGNAFLLHPDGDTKCAFAGHKTPGPPAGRQLPFDIRQGDKQACAYYCGPGAKVQVTFSPAPASTPATDNADDPLC